MKISWPTAPTLPEHPEITEFLKDLLECVKPLQLVASGLNIFEGTGSPENVVTANIGSLFLRRDGGTNTTLYVKESGTGATGWSAKS